MLHIVNYSMFYVNCRSTRHKLVPDIVLLLLLTSPQCWRFSAAIQPPEAGTEHGGQLQLVGFG